MSKVSAEALLKDDMFHLDDAWNSTEFAANAIFRCTGLSMRARVRLLNAIFTAQTKIEREMGNVKSE
jgi:hypothetical protein